MQVLTRRCGVDGQRFPAKRCWYTPATGGFNSADTVDVPAVTHRPALRLWQPLRRGASPSAAFDFRMAELLRRYAERDLPDLWTFDLPYGGCRFVHSRDVKRFRLAGIAPWGLEPVAGS